MRLPLLLCLLLAGLTGSISAQSLLNKNVTLSVTKKPVKEVLSTVGEQAGFSFSYTTTLFNGDSLVSLSLKNRPVKVALEMLFGSRFQYRELDNHVIILPSNSEKWYTITGYVTDRSTGQRLSDVSVVERQQLAATLTDADGNFKLYIKENPKYSAALITISKGAVYTDTLIVAEQGTDRVIVAELEPADHQLPEVGISNKKELERSWLGRMLVSSSLRKQSANLQKFLVSRKYQFSLLPGIGNHGKLSGAITNTFSFNVLGGYSSGIEGFEVGGLFNIDKKSMCCTQVAGLFNSVNGSATGVQVAGLVNSVADSVNGVQVSGLVSLVNKNINGLAVSGVFSKSERVTGLQIAGVSNFIAARDTSYKGGLRNIKPMKWATIVDTQYKEIVLKGMQVAGVVNITHKSVYGMQLAGVTNTTGGDVTGMQLAGLVNTTKHTVNGMQVAGMINMAQRVDGVQLGIVNVCDSINGYAIGLLNIARKGYHRIVASATEVLPVNLSYKSGHYKLYSIITVGVGERDGETGYLYGYGTGTELRMKKTPISFPLELTANSLVGNGDIQILMARFEPGVNLRIFKFLNLQVAPSVTYCPWVKASSLKGYFELPAHAENKPYDNGYVWLGWRVSLNVL